VAAVLVPVVVPLVCVFVCAQRVLHCVAFYFMNSHTSELQLTTLSFCLVFHSLQVLFEFWRKGQIVLADFRR